MISGMRANRKRFVARPSDRHLAAQIPNERDAQRQGFTWTSGDRQSKPGGSDFPNHDTLAIPHQRNKGADIGE